MIPRPRGGFFSKNKAFSSEHKEEVTSFYKLLKTVNFNQMVSREDSMKIFNKENQEKFFTAGVNFGFPYDYRWWAYKAIFKVDKPPGKVINKMIRDHEGVRADEFKVTLDRDV